ncbi:hypothetical protein GYH30_031460 [Glycine max]|nr:hypothetical protein GYH30_031460 [Glycine max]
MDFQCPGSKLALSHMYDWLILLLLAAIEEALNMIEPFHCYILSVFIPMFIFVAFYLARRDVYDLHLATLGLMFSSLIIGVITDSIKDVVGRPRPNFFQRCFLDNIPIYKVMSHSFDFKKIYYNLIVFHKGNGDVVCTGIKAVIKEGYKSFPSEHTSWSFAGLGFLSWYLSRKVRVFDRRGNIGKLCLVLLPLLIAALVGITRVDDYWRHWTDVFVGGLIGLTVSSICYLLLFSLPTLPHGWAPHVLFHMMGESDSPSQRGSQTPHATRLDEFTLQMTEMESGTRYVNV